MDDKRPDEEKFAGLEIITTKDGQTLSPLWFDEDERWYVKVFDKVNDMVIYEEVIPYSLFSGGVTLTVLEEEGSENALQTNNVIKYSISRAVGENEKLREANSYKINDLTRYSPEEDGSVRISVHFDIGKYVKSSEENRAKRDDLFELN